MRVQVKQPKKVSNVIQCKTKASRQAPIEQILQRYSSLGESGKAKGESAVQREAIRHEDEEFESVENGKVKGESEFFSPFISPFSPKESLSPFTSPLSPNKTGLPDNLKSGIENLSGYSMDDVRVHYNSSKPTQLQALAYTQGTDIHVAPGQEKHLPHEAWHVVQQMQGRVQPTMQLQGVNVNDNEGLEREADEMGGKMVPITKNQRTTRLSNNPKKTLQRVVVADHDPESILIDKFNRQVECVQIITAHIYTNAFYENPNTIMPNFDSLYDLVNGVYEEAIKDYVLSEVPIPISSISKKVTEISHKKWLANAETSVDLNSLEKKGILSLTHDKMQKNPMPFLNHYDLFDKNMIWRWTSRPFQEQIYTAKIDNGGKEITYSDILGVIARHSGGNDKSNSFVKTLSFGRNPAALMGTAASVGGDKHVLNIIDKAEYLYGIDINTLAEHGITAHAAFTRYISLFESEYVLVRTPGLPSISLEKIASMRYKNPFKGNAMEIMEINRNSMIMIEKEMGRIIPETKTDIEDIDLSFASSILSNAQKIKTVADNYSFVIRDKEALDSTIASRSLTEFTKDLSPKSK